MTGVPLGETLAEGAGRIGKMAFYLRRHDDAEGKGFAFHP